ncbi:hypothetical protein FB451DRAFT_1368117 [Mycena latifolia]|nr:hypothetical protein FB451DRAFT_1368117 [Mycena latifolia]
MSSRVPHQLYSLFAQTALALGISLLVLGQQKGFTALRTGVRTKRDLQRQICRRALSLRRFQAYLMAQRLSHRGTQRDLKSDSPTQCAIRTNVLGRIPLAGDKGRLSFNLGGGAIDRTSGLSKLVGSESVFLERCGRETGGGESCSLQIMRKGEPLAEEEVVGSDGRHTCLLCIVPHESVSIFVHAEIEVAKNFGSAIPAKEAVRVGCSSGECRPGGTKGGFVSWIRLAECGGRSSERPTSGLRLPRPHYSSRTCDGARRGDERERQDKLEGAALKHYPTTQELKPISSSKRNSRPYSRAGPRCSLLRDSPDVQDETCGMTGNFTRLEAAPNLPSFTITWSPARHPMAPIIDSQSPLPLHSTQAAVRLVPLHSAHTAFPLSEYYRYHRATREWSSGPSRALQARQQRPRGESRSERPPFANTDKQIQISGAYQTRRRRLCSDSDAIQPLAGLGFARFGNEAECAPLAWALPPGNAGHGDAGGVRREPPVVTSVIGLLVKGGEGCCNNSMATQGCKQDSSSWDRVGWTFAYLAAFEGIGTKPGELTTARSTRWVEVEVTEHSRTDPDSKGRGIGHLHLGDARGRLTGLEKGTEHGEDVRRDDGFEGGTGSEAGDSDDGSRKEESLWGCAGLLVPTAFPEFPDCLVRVRTTSSASQTPTGRTPQHRVISGVHFELVFDIGLLVIFPRFPTAKTSAVQFDGADYSKIDAHRVALAAVSVAYEGRTHRLAVPRLEADLARRRGLGERFARKLDSGLRLWLSACLQAGNKALSRRGARQDGNKDPPTSMISWTGEEPYVGAGNLLSRYLDDGTSGIGERSPGVAAEMEGESKRERWTAGRLGYFPRSGFDAWARTTRAIQRRDSKANGTMSNPQLQILVAAARVAFEEHSERRYPPDALETVHKLKLMAYEESNFVRLEFFRTAGENEFYAQMSRLFANQLPRQLWYLIEELVGEITDQLKRGTTGFEHYGPGKSGYLFPVLGALMDDLLEQATMLFVSTQFGDVLLAVREAASTITLPELPPPTTLSEGTADDGVVQLAKHTRAFQGEADPGQARFLSDAGGA